MMPVIIVGGIRFGVVTPTEAGAVAVAYALIVMLKNCGFHPKQLYQMMSEAVVDVGVIGLIVAASAPFGWITIAERIPQRVMEFVLGITTSKLLVLLLINVFLLILGMPLEPPPLMLIIIPIFEPLLTQLGIDPVHFGIVVIANAMIGCVTPPVGSLVFIVSAISRVPASVVFREVVPMILVLCVGLLLITYIPGISLLVPALLNSK
jgi:tripartite ATP-independent transporter DctM subunit